MFVIPELHPIRNGFSTWLRNRAELEHGLLCVELNPYYMGREEPSRLDSICIQPVVDGTPTNRPVFADLEFNGYRYTLVYFGYELGTGRRSVSQRPEVQLAYDKLIPRGVRLVHGTDVRGV